MSAFPIPAPGQAPVDPIAIFSAFATQIGGRHLVFNLTEAQKRIFAHPLTQKLILFGMFYFSTRNLKMAALLWIVYHMGLWILLNETSSFNILPRKWLAAEGFIDGSVEKGSKELYKEHVHAQD